MADTVTDPVCGMAVDPDSAAATSEYEGHRYYFCSQQCAMSFDADPAQFAQAGTG